MAIVRKIPWTRKPPPGTQLDFSNPFVRDMFFFCACDMPGDQRNLIDGRAGVLDVNGSGSALDRIATPKGIVQKFDLSGTNDDYKGYNFGNTGGSGAYEPTAITMLARFRPEGTYHSGWSRVISKRNTGGTSDDYAIMLETNAEVHIRISGGDQTVFPSNIDGSLCEISGDGGATGGNNRIRFWNLDTGDTAVSAVSAAEAVDQGTADLCLGFRDNENRGFDGELHYVAIWNTRKSETFLNAFRANPWQIFKPQTNFLPLSFPTPTTTTKGFFPKRQIHRITGGAQLPDTNNYITSSLPPNFPVGPPWTIASLSRLDGGANTADTVLEVRDGSVNLFALRFQDRTGPTPTGVQVRLNTATTVEQATDFTEGSVADAWCFFGGAVGEHDGSGSDIRMWTNTGAQAALDSSNETYTAPAAPTRFSINTSHQESSSDTSHVYIAVWNRMLTENQCRQLMLGAHPFTVERRGLSILATWPKGKAVDIGPYHFDLESSLTGSTTALANPARAVKPYIQTRHIPISVAAAAGNDLVLTASVILSIAAELTAQGTLSAAQSLSLTVAADLSAEGQLEAATSLLLSLVADLMAAGNIAAAVTLQLSLSAGLDAQGALALAPSIALTVAADVEAQGTLAAAQSLSITVAAALNSAGVTPVYRRRHIGFHYG